MRAENRIITLRGHAGHGSDIASVEEDQLDRDCLTAIDTRLKTGSSCLVLDIGGGHGAMSVKMAKRGATVTLVDPLTEPQHIRGQNVHHVAKSILHLEAGDIAGLSPTHRVAIIYAQRSLHYLTFADACTALHNCRIKYAVPDCLLFFSVGALDSPLGATGYTGTAFAVDDARRFAVPHNEEADYVQITTPMTLYAPQELKRLVEESGFVIRHVWRSALGTFKVTAESA